MAKSKLIEVTTTEQLADVLTAYKDYRIVTDVGASMCSGWGNLRQVEVYDDSRTLELIFD